MAEEKVKVHRERITQTTAIFMISLALVFDLIQFGLDFIPVVGWVINLLISFFATAVFYTWTSLLGIGFSDTILKALSVGQKALLKWTAALLEYVPVIGGIVPGITVGVVANILFVWSEDTIYNASHGKVDVEKITKSAEKHAKKRDSFKTDGGKINISDIVAGAQDNDLIPRLKNEKNEEIEMSNFSLQNIQDWQSKTKKEKIKSAFDGIKSLKKQSKNDLSTRKDRVRDNNTTPEEDRKRKVLPFDETAEFEDLPMEKKEKNNPILNEGEGGQDKQEFSMGDIYREPIDITPKKNNLKNSNKKNDDEDLDLAA